MTSSDLVPDLAVDLVPILVVRFERSAFVLVSGLSTSSRRRPGDRDEVAPEDRTATRDLRVSARPEVTGKSRRPTSSRDHSSDPKALAKPTGHSLADLVPILVATSSRPDTPSRDEVTHHTTSTNTTPTTSSRPRPGRPRDDVSDLVPRPRPYRDEDERREQTRHNHPQEHPVNARLTPTSRQLYIVRWIREDGRDVRHKHFTRETDARAFLARLQDYGKDAALFTTHTDWKPA